MKKLKLNLANMPGTEVLTREQLKAVMGGDTPGSGTGTPGGNNGNPCVNCRQIMQRHDDGRYGYGMCPPNVGGTSCHNYCADGYNGGSGYYGWC